MNNEHVLKGGLECTKFGPGKHREFSVAPTIDPTVVRMHQNKRHIPDLVLVSKENKRCTSQHMRITIVELHSRLLLTKFR